jgi:hypothetical protein
VPQSNIELAKAVLFCLFVGLLIVPTIMRDPVARDDGAGAIAAALTMHENRGDLVIGRRVQAHRNCYESHAQRFHHALLPIRLFGNIPKINNSSDTQFRQRLESSFIRLTASIEMLVDLLELPYSGRLCRY